MKFSALYTPPTGLNLSIVTLCIICILYLVKSTFNTQVQLTDFLDVLLSGCEVMDNKVSSQSKFWSSGGVVVQFLACGARGLGFDSQSHRYDFRDWLFPASKS